MDVELHHLVRLAGSGVGDLDRDRDGVLGADRVPVERWRWPPVYGPQVARRVRARAGVAAKPLPELAEREREVLDLMAAGLPNPAIAGRLHLSEKSVRNYVTNIFIKLGVPDRSSAIVKAREAGLGRPR